MMKFFERWLWRCELVLIYAAVISTAAMMVLTTADAAARYLLNSPLMGAYEITEKYLMVAAIFLGLSYAVRGGAFIRVTFLVDRLPRRTRLVADHVAHLASLAFALVVLAATGQQAWRALADATTLSTVPVPLGPAYCLVPLGFLAMTVLMAVDLPQVRHKRSRLLAQDAPVA